jgi:hypothetical protein
VGGAHQRGGNSIGGGSDLIAPGGGFRLWSGSDGVLMGGG